MGQVDTSKHVNLKQTFLCLQLSNNAMILQYHDNFNNWSQTMQRYSTTLITSLTHLLTLITLLLILHNHLRNSKPGSDTKTVTPLMHMPTIHKYY